MSTITANAARSSHPITSSHANITVFSELLSNALDDCDVALNGLSQTSDLQVKQSKLKQCAITLASAEQLRKSFVLELSLLNSEEKLPFRTIQTGYDARFLRIAQVLKTETNWILKSNLKVSAKTRQSGPECCARPSHHDEMLDATINKQHEIDETINRVKTTAREIVTSGKEIAQTLEVQTEQINSIEKTIKEIDDETHRARSALSSLFRRIMTDKVLLALSFILITLAIIAVIVLV